MNTKRRFSIFTGFFLSLVTIFPAQGGEDLTIDLPKKEKKGKKKSNGDWCKTLGDLGSIYDVKKKENPWIQKVELSGRIHYQYGYTDGKVNDQEFSAGGDELRRFRLGASVRFLGDFYLNAAYDLKEQGFRMNRTGDPSEWNKLTLAYDFGDVLGVEDLTVGYGLYKVGFGGEENLSSTKIKTIERSMLNNTFDNDRSTGSQVEFTIEKVDFLLGFYTTDSQSGTFGEWSSGKAFHLATEFEAWDGDFLIQGIYHDRDPNEIDPTFSARWAVSAAYTTEVGNWDLLVDARYGEFVEGNVYGLVILPSTFIVEDRVEAVFRYQWAHSTGQQLRPNNRNTRNVTEFEGVRLPRGDNHHSFYAGLNFHLCPKNLNLMTGVEYERFDGDFGHADATTLWTALRLHF